MVSENTKLTCKFYFVYCRFCFTCAHENENLKSLHCLPFLGDLGTLTLFLCRGTEIEDTARTHVKGDSKEIKLEQHNKR